MIRPPMLRLDYDELIVDSFAGGGGASQGIEEALGRGPDIAINHDAEAIALHAANHPRTKHFQENVWKVDPRAATGGKPVGLMWLSPDCTHHSKARGGKPRKKKLRGLAWVAVRWAAAVRPRVIVLENVEEFQTWGPLTADGQPCPKRKGRTFRAFIAKLERLGYAVEWRELRGCDYGAPTIRKRLFLIARCDRQPIRWPAPTHGKGTVTPWRTAAECIDWSIPCPSIFARKRPLAENTLKRIARGIRRFVLEAERPFIVSLTHHGGDRVESIDKPFATITGAHRGEKALVAPVLVPRYGERVGQEPRVRSVEQPLSTIVPTQNGAQLAAAFLARHYGGHENDGAQFTLPIPTITSKDHHAVVASSLVKLRGTSKDGQPLTTPLHTISAGGLHHAEVRAFMVAYFGNEKDGGALTDPMRTLTSKDRFGLVTVAGIDYAIADIGMRMLAPRELYRAQGFPDSYRIEIEFNGKPLTKTAQVRMVGNSVCPPLARAIVLAQFMGDSLEAVA